MQTIVVRPELLRSVSQRLRSEQGNLREIGARLQQAAHQLDWELTQRINLSHQISDVFRAAERLSAEAQALSSFLSRTAQNFEEADRQGATDLNQTGQTAAQWMREFATAIYWLQKMGFPLSAASLIAGLGGLFLPGVFGPGVRFAPTVPQDRTTPAGGTAPGGSAQEKANFWMQLGMNSLLGRKTTLYEQKTGIDGLTVLHAETDGTETSGSVVHYKKEGDVAGHKVEGTVSAVNLEVEHTILESGVIFSAAEVKGEARLAGNDDINMSVETSARAGVAKAKYDINPFDGDIETEAYVAAVEGDASAKVKIFNQEAKIGVTGCFKCAGASVKLGAEGHIKVAILGGIGINWDFRRKKK